jgi:hypothetical protein
MRSSASAFWWPQRRAGAAFSRRNRTREATQAAAAPFSKLHQKQQRVRGIAAQVQMYDAVFIKQHVFMPDLY